MADREKAERMLWDYRQNVKKAEGLRMLAGQLMSVRGQDYGAHIVNSVSDPVSEVVHRRIELGKKIKKLDKEIHAVDELNDSLPMDELNTWHMREILRRRYMEHKKPDEVMREMGITKATYYRRNNELIERAVKYA